MVDTSVDEWVYASARGGDVTVTPALDLLFKKSDDGPPAYAGGQVWEAEVSRVTDRGAFVMVRGFSQRQRWGPCLPVDAAVEVGDVVAVAMSDKGRPWLLTARGEAPVVPALDAVAWQGPHHLRSGEFEVPFEADVLVVLTATAFGQASGLNGVIPRLDGVDLSNWAIYFFNEALNHKQLGCSNVVRGVAPGAHTLSLAYAWDTTSDNGDYASWGLTMTPVG